FMRRQRALQFDATPVQSANFRFRIVLKGNGKVAADKTAERLVCALEVADKANPDMAAMVEGIELTLKSMLDVVRKFGVEVIAET
ncbi:hypothetical protein MJM95_27985, partial [Salmonella enterica subsp. enterica serovar Anatum]|nr:hypothetical protein [Salmonella enterica subsp. enterica serovar Anatum]